MKTETDQHTRTPWIKAGHSGIIGTPIMAQPDPSKNSITIGMAHKDEDAAFIVRAVNEYGVLKATESLCQDNLAYATKTRAEINSLIDWLKQINGWEKPEDKAIAIRVKLERMGAIAKAEGRS